MGNVTREEVSIEVDAKVSSILLYILNKGHWREEVGQETRTGPKVRGGRRDQSQERERRIHVKWARNLRRRYLWDISLKVCQATRSLRRELQPQSS